MHVTWKKVILGCLVFGAAAGGAVIVEANAPHHTSGEILVGAHIPSDVRTTFESSCQDCHSNNTYWPIYAHLPIISTLIHEDVEKGRKTMNFSDWQDYSRGKKVGYLALIQNSLHKRIMPPVKYTALHFHAKLSAKQLDAIEKWTVEEMQRLMHEK